MSCDVGEVTERLENERSSFFNPSFASPTSQALHLRHLASRPCCLNTPKWVLGQSFVEFWNFYINCYNFMIFLSCILHHKTEENAKSEFNWSLNFELLAFKLILMFEFQNVPCALGFDVKHSKFVCRSFRTCIIILIMDFTINKLFWSLYIKGWRVIGISTSLIWSKPWWN